MVLKGYHAKGNGTGCQPPAFAGAGSERVSVATIWDWPGHGPTVLPRSFHRGPLGPALAAVPRYGQDYVDAGAEYYESQYQQRALRAAKRRAAQLGYQLVPMSDAADHATHAPPGVAIAA